MKITMYGGTNTTKYYSFCSVSIDIKAFSTINSHSPTIQLNGAKAKHYKH